MFPIQTFRARFQDILEALDELKAQSEGEAADALDELNAGFEDALFVIECTVEDEDWREAFEDALEEFDDLYDEYMTWSDAVPGLEDAAVRLRMTSEMARQNLGGQDETEDE